MRLCNRLRGDMSNHFNIVFKVLRVNTGQMQVHTSGLKAKLDPWCGHLTYCDTNLKLMWRYGWNDG